MVRFWRIRGGGGGGEVKKEKKSQDAEKNCASQAFCMWLLNQLESCECVRSLFFVEFGSQDEISICVSNQRVFVERAVESYYTPHTLYQKRKRKRRDRQTCSIYTHRGIVFRRCN